MIIINFKNYVSGKDSLLLSKKIEKILGKKEVIVCPSFLDLSSISDKTDLVVFGQHILPIETKKTTGFFTIDTLKNSGASGTLINHSEHRVPLHYIKDTLKICKKNKLHVIVCVTSLKETREILKLRDKPFAMAFEDPKLIGSGKSITKCEPWNVEKFVWLLEKTKIMAICGAGITNERDVESAYGLGCDGVLISSSIANNKNVCKLLKEIGEKKR